MILYVEGGFCGITLYAKQASLEYDISHCLICLLKETENTIW